VKASRLSREALLKLFKDPPQEYSDFVTWFWEAGQLDKKQLTWQLEELKRKGVGGTWFYPRYMSGEPYGTFPAYFTEGWWDFFRHSVEEHHRLGLEAWFSGWEGRGFWRDRLRADRDRLPELTGRRLVVHEVEADGSDPVEIEVSGGEAILSAVAYRRAGGGLDGGSAQDLADAIDGRRLAWEAPEPGWVVTVVASQPHDLNYLDPVVAERYIDIYWRPHEEKLREFVGNTLKLYGQDEMFVLDGNILYSPLLLERFEAEKGYDPRPYLAGLFYDIGDFSDMIRCDYYEVMSALLEENYYRRLYQWHKEREILFGTIATWGRQDMLGQTWHYGDFFRLMRHFDVTGNEDPGSSEPGERCFIDAKLSSSVLHIYERDRAGMCVYWNSGWGMTQEQNLAWTNENYAYGLNLYNTHGGLYSTLGGLYEWVPPSVHWRQPYWEHWKTFVDYISRLSAVMSQGVHRADVALLYPLTTIHANWLKGDHFTAAADDAATATFALARHIYRSGIDFDFVDDDTLARAEVDDGKLKVAGLEFRAVVLPPMTTIRTATLEKLKAFYEGGGTVVAFRRLPGASQEKGRNDPTVRALLIDIFGIPSSEEYAHPTRVHTQAGDSVWRQENPQGGQAFFVPSQEIHGSVHRRWAPGVPEALSFAITRDVVCSGKDVFHTHQKVGDLDVYFLYNVRPEGRELRFAFRVCGEPEIWDPVSGRVIPVYRFACDSETTTVRLTMERNAGVILVFSPRASRPAVLEDNLAEITSVEPGDDDRLVVQGIGGVAGKKRVRILHGGQEYVGEARLPPLPAPMTLEGDWGFELKPTMNNRWGDFRYPASDEFIGAEARCFHYAEEGEQSGVELGWHEAAFDAGSWPVVTRSFGPYWYTVGPFRSGEEPADLVERAVAGEVEPGEWERFSFSQRFGYEGIDDPAVWGGRQGVLDEFIYFPARGDGCDAKRYLFTYVQAPDDGDWDLHLGSREGQVRRVWLNGKQVFPSESGGQGSSELRVHLREGLNTVLVELVHVEGQEIRAFVAFQNPEYTLPPEGPPAVPRLRWFVNPSDLVYDIMPGKGKRVGWYRFEAPSGTQAMRLGLDAEGVQAWVNGQPVSVRNGEIRLDAPVDGVAQVALRVEQKPGVYAGAALPEPVEFECAPTCLPLGDWCNYALESYSGGAVYIKTFDLNASHLQGRVILDLGMVNTVAEVAVNGRTVGVGLGRPYCFDVTDYVREGENQLQVTVYNTLANYYSVGVLRSAFVYEGQTLSGLIGPVTLRFPAEVTLIASPALSA